jgi:hypothetical protein
MKACVIEVCLGISRARTEEDLENLHEVLGSFEFIDFNLARVGERAFSLRIKRSRVPNAQQSVMTIDETVGGLLDDNLRLTYGEHVEFLEHFGSAVRVRFTSWQK